MNPDEFDLLGYQPDLFEAEQARSMLDQLLMESRLYRRSREYGELLQFVSRLRAFAPFNAMLLHIQKPGLSYAATARDWRERFGRYPSEGVRPLLVLRPFGPVSLVYDVTDTEGRPLPRDVTAFRTSGQVAASDIDRCRERLERRTGIDWCWLDAGDNHAGWIRLLEESTGGGRRYRVGINRNHGPAVQLTTLAHELAHLFLGHLGADGTLSIGDRMRTDAAQKELEAESVAYLVCRRQGVEPHSQPYLSNFVENHSAATRADIYQVMRVAGQVETLLGLTMEQEPPRQPQPTNRELDM